MLGELSLRIEGRFGPPFRGLCILLVFCAFDGDGELGCRYGVVVSYGLLMSAFAEKGNFPLGYSLPRWEMSNRSLVGQILCN